MLHSRIAGVELVNIYLPSGSRSDEAQTRKEAFIKVYGEGLSRDLNSFEVELRPDHPPRVLVVDGSPATASEFTLFAADPDPQTIAAVCLPRAPRQVQAYRWNGLLR